MATRSVLRARTLSCALLSLALVLSQATALAKEAPIASVEVRTLVEREDRDLREVLREKVESELSRVDLSGAPKGTRLVLSASLVRLETSTKGAASTSSCRVSLVLRDAKRGALRAILDGSALAEDVANAKARVESVAIEGAVRGALRALPDAVKKANLAGARRASGKRSVATNRSRAVSSARTIHRFCRREGTSADRGAFPSYAGSPDPARHEQEGATQLHREDDRGKVPARLAGG
jgi:hypothetical protein